MCSIQGCYTHHVTKQIKQKIYFIDLIGLQMCFSNTAMKCELILKHDSVQKKCSVYTCNQIILCNVYIKEQ